MGNEFSALFILMLVRPTFISSICRLIQDLLLICSHKTRQRTFLFAFQYTFYSFVLYIGVNLLFIRTVVITANSLSNPYVGVGVDFTSHTLAGMLLFSVIILRQCTL